MPVPGSSDTTRADGPVDGVACSNCGHLRSDRFCAKCGQNDRDYIRSLPPVLGDILKETFELDSRFLHTIKPMFFRPGELPSEFSRNRRASYVSPIRLYIFASLAFFFLLSLTTDFGPPRAVDVDVELHDRDGLARFSKEASENADVEAFKALLPPMQQRKVDDILSRSGMFLSKSIIYSLAAIPDADMEQIADWQRFALARAVDAFEDPRAVFSLLLDNLPFAMFITLPAYAALLMLFFVGSRRFFTEHLVFAVQLHTFAFIVFAVLVLLPDGEEPRRPPLQRDVAVLASAQTSASAAAPTLRRASADDEGESSELVDWINVLLMFWVFAYHYLALRRYYGNGRVKTAIKWAMLSFAYAILLIPGFLLSLTLTFVQL